MSKEAEHEVGNLTGRLQVVSFIVDQTRAMLFRSHGLAFVSTEKVRQRLQEAQGALIHAISEVQALEPKGSD